MVTLLLKKSYQHKDHKEIKFNDLWNAHGVFTTMRVVGKNKKILFFKEHIDNLIKSLKNYGLNRKDLKKTIVIGPNEYVAILILKKADAHINDNKVNNK